MRLNRRIFIFLSVVSAALYLATYGRIFSIVNSSNNDGTDRATFTPAAVKTRSTNNQTTVTGAIEIDIPSTFILVTHPSTSPEELKKWGRIIIARKTRKVSTSGGTKSLHQLHHTLNQLGYNSYYFGLGEQFRNKYSKPMYDLSPKLVTPEDLIVIPDAQNSTVFVPWDVSRVASMLLGQHYSHAVSVKLLRGTVYLPSIASLRDAFSCASALTLEAPLDDFFYEKADRQMEKYSELKENLVLLDCDDSDLPKKILHRKNVTYTALGCHGSKASPSELVQLYTKAKAIVDLHLPGRERMLWEAILFGVCPLVAYHQSGHSLEWAMPHEWQLDRHDPKQWDRVVDRCLSDYNTSIVHFKAIHEHAWTLPVRWMQNVDRVFSTRSVLFFTAATSSHEEELALIWALSVFAQCPLATVEILIHNLTLFHENWGSILYNWRAAGGQWYSLHFTEAKAALAEYGPAAALHLRPRFLRHAQFVYIVPVTALLTAARSINKLVYQLEQATQNFSMHAYLSINYQTPDCNSIQAQFTQSERYTWINKSDIVQVRISYPGVGLADVNISQKELTESECPLVDISYCAQNACSVSALRALQSSLDFALYRSILSGLSYSLQKIMQDLLSV